MFDEYTKLRLELTGFDKDILSAELFQAGSSGIEEISENLWIAYFTKKMEIPVLTSLLTRLRQINPVFQETQILSSTEKNQDWNSEWKKYFRVQKVGQRIWISPPWDKPSVPQEEILLIIDPQMAFGTGTHESTQLVMITLEKYIKEGFSVLDVGTGSGILAILAKKLGAGYTLAFDIDQCAIDNAKHNAFLNNTADIDFLIGNQKVIPGNNFNIILANINQQVLIEMIPVLVDHLASHGKLILSGILQTDKNKMLSAIPSGLKVLEDPQKNEWLAIVLEKQKI
jgi:ribosomal protein L11 methyltransferase